MVADAAGKQLFLFGGLAVYWDGGENEYFKDLWKFQIEAGATVPRHVFCMRSCLAVLCEACRGQSLSQHEVWFVLSCWQELKWTELELLEPVPQAREAHSAVLDSEGKMWIFAGRNVSPNRLGDMWRCDVQAEAWELGTCPVLHVARFSGACHAFESCVLLSARHLPINGSC